MAKSTRERIKHIVNNLGCKTGEHNGHFYIDRGEYRLYIVNAKEFSLRNNGETLVKEHRFEWVVKRDTDKPDVWKEVYRMQRSCFTNELGRLLKHDLSILEKFIAQDIQKQKVLFSNELAKIAIQCGLNVKSEKVQRALKMAYDLGLNKR